MRTVISTVGTSLLRSFEKSSLNFVTLLTFVNTADPRKACAETNALSRLLQEGDRLIFLHSDTEEGKLCAGVLAQHYAQNGYETIVDCIRYLSYREAHFRLRGLRSLVGKLADLIERERTIHKREVIINATGGFKAEGVYATLVGLLFNVPVWYIHEMFQEVVKMPVLPVDWNYAVIAEHEDFLRFVSEELRSKQEVRRFFPTIPESIASMLEEEDNFVLLSPAGEAVFRAYREKLQVAASMPVFLSKNAQQWFLKADSAVKERIKSIIRKIKLPEVRRSQIKVLKSSPCFVYPQGHQDERILFCEKDETLWICALVRHSDRSYETLLQQKIRCKDKDDFVPFVED
ncbi:MAG: putative CRISPR-associated protein [Atribacterota bacterium]